MCYEHSYFVVEEGPEGRNDLIKETQQLDNPTRSQKV